MPRRPLRSGRLLTGGLLLGAAGAALAPAGPDALVPFKILAASAADDVYVAVIIDFGNGSNISSIQKCVPVPSGSTDADALAAAVGESNVAYGTTGLLCSIDGYPVNGVQNCNASAGTNYYFWSYWHGANGSWSYANDGPAEHGATDGDVQGWRFQNPGPANPSAPPPGPPPNYMNICGVHVPSTTTTNSPAGSGPTTTTAAPSTGTGSGGATTPTTASGSSGPAHAQTSTKASSTNTKSGGSTTTTLTTAAPASGKSSSTSTSKQTTTASSRERLALANTDSHQPKGSSGGAWLPILIVTLIVAALAVLAVVRIRRRPAEE